MLTPPPDRPPTERIEQYLDRAGLAAAHPRVVGLTPDASDRRYFRVEADGRDPFVLAVHAGPIDFARMPFAIVSRLLSEMALPAPAVLGHDDGAGETCMR